MRRLSRLAVQALSVFTLAAAGLTLSACANLPDYPTTCTDRGSSSDSWPYCAPAEPGGSLPSDDRIDPTGHRN